MPPRLRRDGPVPIYQQILEWMRVNIASGRWAENHKLKSETDLVEDLGVSRGTIRRAIGELIDEGLLVRVHGRGTFVSRPKLEQPLADNLVTFSEDLITQGIPFETTVLEQEVVQPGEAISALLNVAPDGKVFALKRLRAVGGVPVILLHNYVVYDRCPAIETCDFHNERLFEVLEQEYDLHLAWGKRTFEARAGSASVRARLELEKGDPLMYIQQLVHLEDGSPIELSDLWIRGDRFKLSTRLKREAFHETEKLLSSS